MDGTIVDFSTPLCERYNALYRTNIRPKDIKKWNLVGCMDFPKAREIYNSKGFFYNLKPYDNAIEVLQKLNEKHNIVIATKPETISVAIEKYRWIEKYLPFIKFENITMTSYKSTMDFNALIDDNVDYLEQFKGIRICYNQPYNQNCNCDHRAYNWENVEWTIKFIDDYFKMFGKESKR